MKRFIIIFLIFSVSNLIAQHSFWKKSDTLDLKKRKTLVVGGGSAYVLSMVGVNQLWYAGFDRSSLHSVDDNQEWLQMDKFGHIMTSYYIGKVGMELLDWAGESRKNQLIYGASLGFVFLSTVEMFDGYSKEWGFSFGDIAANASGTGLLICQELLWKEQRIQLKYSFHQTRFAKQNPELLGENFIENTLKDYNGQTYWLSANIWSFKKESKFPKWLNIAFGYGAENMITANATPNDNRFRQYYLGLDVDLTKIKTKSKFLKTIFSAVNFIKIPAPTISYSPEEKFKIYAFYF